MITKQEDRPRICAEGNFDDGLYTHMTAMTNTLHQHLCSYDLCSYVICSDDFVVVAYTCMACVVMDYIVMAHVAMAYISVLCVVMTYIVMACAGMAHMAMVHTVTVTNTPRQCRANTTFWQELQDDIESLTERLKELQTVLQ